MADLSDFEVGQAVELQDGRIAIVRYAGNTHFAAGDWIGVALEDASGKNDGAVQGQRYFDCEPRHGMFVRPSAVRPLEEPTPKANGKTNGSGGKERPQSSQSVIDLGTAKRRSIVDAGAAKRHSVNAQSPTPGLRGPAGSRMLRSPTQSPTKQSGTTTSSRTSASRMDTPSTVRAPPSSTVRPRASIGSRPSMGPPATQSAITLPPRRSLAGPPNGSAVGGSAINYPSRSALGNQPSLRPGIGKRLSSLSGGSQASEGSGLDSVDEEEMPETDAPVASERQLDRARKTISPALSKSSAAVSSPSLPSSRETSSPTITQRPAFTSTVANREVEDLKTKLRVMEKKRMEDRERMKSLDRVRTERDKFEGIIQRLQSKYQPQQQEMTELRDQLKESETKIKQIEAEQADHDVIIEMATLDREMAEETAEVLRTELNALKQKADEMELEVEVLREENHELGQEMSPEEKTSQGWLQMERSNERLREALMRLRELTQQQEGEMKDQIKSLEEDVGELEGVKELLEATREKLSKSDASIEDLRQQLDTALGAEAMIEELTEQNMTLNERIEGLRATVEDLQDLKELNDELEFNHVETEKQMQEEIDFKNMLVADQARKHAQQEKTLQDYDYTTARFRELVTNLQSDLEDMRASQQLTETEAEDLTNRSRAMMDLNMKLQISASKTQAKTIELELRQLEAQEATEHLTIVQMFLPETFQTERDSVLALLRFRRVGFKAHLLHGFVKERVSGQDTLGHEGYIFAACDVMDKLTWVWAMCDRFISAISTCSIEQFAKFEGALFELEPVERALNGWIDGLRKDELSEKQCASELQRSMSLMSHLAEIHIPESLESYAEDVLMRTLLMQSHLENTAVALSHIKTLVRSKITALEADSEEVQYFSESSDTLVSHARSAKVAISKIVRTIEELKARSLSLNTDTFTSFNKCEDSARELAQCSRRLGEEASTILQEEGRAESITYSEIQSHLSNIAESVLYATDGNLLHAFSSKFRSLSNKLIDLGNLSTDLTMTVEFERAPAPWTVRSKELKSSNVASIDTEEEIRRLRDDVYNRATQLKLRDRTLEESSVKIELLESRMRDATMKGDRITKLERTVDQSKHRERDLAEAIEAQVRDLQNLEIELEKWKKIANDSQATGGSGPHGGKEGKERAVATAREMEVLRNEIESLQGAVRYLREDNRCARLLEKDRTLEWLDEPLTKTSSPQQQKSSLIRAESHDVLNELLYLATSARLVDLSHLPVNKLAWRPAKSTPKYHLCRQREKWEAWASWRDDVVSKGHVLQDRINGVRHVRPKSGEKEDRKVLATVDVRLPGLRQRQGKEGLAKEITIVRPDDFEAFREELGFA
ncbi:MAG: hypothetical protein M1827_005111 [Pycnora praestabilis]|nr:MAG: hypothetical protein M1827_005111 [Pycnora praestabilis]